MARAIKFPTYRVAATKEELLLPYARYCGYEEIITGVGGVNVIRALKDLPRNARIINVGYAGSQWYTKGTEVQICKCRLYHPNCTYREPTFRLYPGDDICLTAGDFVTSGILPERSVVDMELAYILALGFREVKAVKYVSDNLNYEEYGQIVKQNQ